METLDEYNERKQKELGTAFTQMLGISCPKCGAEMLNPAPNIVLTSNPPQIHANCSKCSYKGYAVI